MKRIIQTILAVTFLSSLSSFAWNEKEQKTPMKTCLYHNDSGINEKTAYTKSVESGTQLNPKIIYNTGKALDGSGN